MVPRFARMEREFDKAIQKYIRIVARGSGVLSEVKTHVIHEGRSSSIRRAPEEIEVTKMKEAGAEVSLSFDEIEMVNLDVILSKANLLAEQFRKQFSAYFFETINESSEKTGQTVDAKGPLTNEIMLQMIDKMEVNFERNKQVGDFSIVTSPQMVPTFQKLEAELKSNPSLQRKWDQLLERKRNDFREREINRNLVG